MNIHKKRDARLALLTTGVMMLLPQCLRGHSLQELPWMPSGETYALKDCQLLGEGCRKEDLVDKADHAAQLRGINRPYRSSFGSYNGRLQTVDWPSSKIGYLEMRTSRDISGHVANARPG